MWVRGRWVSGRWVYKDVVDKEDIGKRRVGNKNEDKRIWVRGSWETSTCIKRIWLGG